MKTILALAAGLCLSVSAAVADCPYHKSMASASADTQTTTASVEQSDISTAVDTQTVKKDVPPKTE